MVKSPFFGLGAAAQDAVERLKRGRYHKKLHAAFSPYLVAEGDYDHKTLVRMCRDVNKYQAGYNLINTFEYYNDFIDFMIKSDHMDIRALREFMDPMEPDRLVIGLRHDMDGDIVTGVKAAASLARRNVSASFYILHTAFYYGRFEEEKFLRYPGVEYFVKQIIETGREFGIHQDPLEIYQGHQINGTQAFETELAWLRLIGADIKGVVAHNSAPSYGAENFEIFEGMAVEGREHIVHRGVDTPLQTTSLAKLKLEYEGNFIKPPNRGELHVLDYYIKHPPAGGLRLPEWQSRYFLYNPVFERRYDASLWLLGQDTWVLAHHGKGGRQIEYPLTGADVKSRMESMRGQRLMVNIHPEYVAA
jgi:hypothetical protein